MANYPQNDDASTTSSDFLLKRKAISEMRLRDPKLWDIVGWMKNMFIKDTESGVRKVDFYNYVTGHLGRIGYRDVWHILKIAYPHVDRVRRGRKYMYWGIRHVDDKLEHMNSAALDEGDIPKDCGEGNEEMGDVKYGEDNYSETNNNEVIIKSSSNADINNSCSASNSSANIRKSINVSNVKIGNCSINNNNNINDKRSSNNSSSNSGECFDDNNNNDINGNKHISNNTISTSNNIDEVSNTSKSEYATNATMTGKDNINKDSADAECSTSNEHESDAKDGHESNDEKRALSTDSSSSFVIKSEQFSDDEEETKPQDFLVMEFKEKDVFESFEDYEKAKGISIIGKNGRSSTPPPSIFTDDPSPPSPEFNVKKSEEINGDHNKKCDSSFNESSVTLYQSNEEQESQIFPSSLLKPENINKVCIPLIHDAKIKTLEGEAATATKTGFDPVIVSVESIGSGRSRDHRNSNVLSDGKLTTQSPGVNESELQTVVVQDRGIQVCENAAGNSSRSMRKRKTKEIQCTKDERSSRNEPTSKSHLEASPKPRKRARKRVDKPSGAVVSTSKPPIPLAPKPNTVNSTQQPKLVTSNVVRVPTLPLPSISRGYTASSTNGGAVGSAQGIAAAAKMTSSTYVTKTARPSDVSFKRSEVPVTRARYDHLLLYKINGNNSNNDNQSITRNLQELTSRQNTSLDRPTTEQLSDSNRELIIKILEEHESRIKSTAKSKDNDLQVMVDCLSAEVEKERTMRLRLEIELRKVENQLEQERKLNERLAALLMKR